MTKLKRYFPIIFTVGQVIVFPYYILWLKDAALTYTLFALLFAVHSFAGALGYMFYKKFQLEHIGPLYISNGLIYVGLGLCAYLFEGSIVFVVVVQVCLGLLQGYFKAWHVRQNRYHLDAVHHYIIVGLVMMGIAFMNIFSPVLIIISFGFILLVGGLGMLGTERHAEDFV